MSTDMDQHPEWAEHIEANEERARRVAELHQAETVAAARARVAFAADRAREADRILVEQIHQAAHLGIEALAEATGLAPREAQARWLAWAWRERQTGARTDDELRLHAHELDPTGGVFREYIGGSADYGPQDPPPPAWHRIDRAIY